MKKAFNVKKENFIVDKRLYLCDPEDIDDILRDLSNGLRIVMLVGHNPTFTDIVNAFGNVYVENLPTTGFVQLDFKTDDWKSIASYVT